MEKLPPEEVERIKAEQRIRTTETVKTGLRMYFGFVWKVLKITCGCLGAIIIIGGIIALIATVAPNIFRQFQYQKQIADNIALGTRMAPTQHAYDTAQATTLQAYNLEQTKNPGVILPDNPSATPPQFAPTGTANAISTKAPEPTPTRETPTPIATPIITTYLVRSVDETPVCLARRFDLDLNILLALNNLTMNSKLNAGDEIILPGPDQKFNSSDGNRALKPHPDIYIVEANDNIYKIACKYGDLSPEAIVSENQLTEPYELKPGQILGIP